MKKKMTIVIWHTKSIANVVVALTNVMALLPLHYLFHKKDIISFTIVYQAMIASFFYHLFESHKHNLTGFGTSTKCSQHLLRLDSICASILFLYITTQSFLHEYYKDKKLWILTLFAFLCFGLSEFNSFFSQHKWQFAIVHGLWHVIGFYIVYYVSKKSNSKKKSNTC